MKFLISVKVPFSLDKEIEAKDQEEAEKIAEELEPQEFDNFHSFYEYLGSEFKNLVPEIDLLSEVL